MEKGLQLQAPCARPVPTQSLFQPFEFVVRPGVQCQARGNSHPAPKQREIADREVYPPSRVKTPVSVTDMKSGEGRMQKTRDADPLISAHRGLL